MYLFVFRKLFISFNNNEMFSTVHALFDITGPASDDQGESVAGSP